MPPEGMIRAVSPTSTLVKSELGSFASARIGPSASARSAARALKGKLPGGSMKVKVPIARPWVKVDSRVRTTGPPPW
jgi:hypothetical protein